MRRTRTVTVPGTLAAPWPYARPDVFKYDTGFSVAWPVADAEEAVSILG